MRINTTATMITNIPTIFQFSFLLFQLNYFDNTNINQFIL